MEDNKKSADPAHYLTQLMDSGETWEAWRAFLASINWDGMKHKKFDSFGIEQILTSSDTTNDQT